MDFDFGPISRTVSGGRKDSFNLTSLPLHEVMNALMAADDRDEFVAWLWHDVFKPLFWFRKKPDGSLSWIHVANDKSGDPLAREVEWSTKTRIPPGLVSSHHYRNNRDLTHNEREIISDQFDQTGLGKKARFLQLAFVAEPATNTAILRAVIADAFMGVVTKAVADAIRQQLYSKQPIFDRVRYVFEFGYTQFSGQPTDTQIKSLTDRYGMEIQGSELIITHFTPVRSSEFDGRQVEVVVDFTAAPPTLERYATGIFSLVELLTVYQDSHTVLMSIPQFLQIDVQQLMQDVQSKTAQRLQELDILTVTPEAKLKKQVKTTSRVDWSKLPLIRQGKDVDLLAHVLNEQIDIRLIDPPSLPPTMYQDHRGMRIQVRLLDEVLDWPLDKLRKKTRHCRLCNSAFDSVLPAGEMTISGTFSPDFTDAEHIGFGGDICPMCRIYALNSHKSRTPSEKADGITGDRKGYRGAFALVTPSSHFAYRDDQNTLVEKQPPLDIGGRFSGILQRATFTLQEFMLFNALSRRVIAKLWQRLYDDDQTRPLSLPYLGAILLTQKRASDVRELFEYTEMLFSEVKLRTYPFQTTVRPAIEFIFEMAINDRKQHHTKHTYLKTNPMTMMISPDSKFTLLVDNALQLEVSRQFFADRKHLGELLSNIKGKKRRRDWLSSVLQGNDPVTATAEAFYDRSAFRQAENTFWEAKMGKGSPAEQWRAYEEVKAEIREIVSRYPLVIEFFINPKR